jgi:hypothetical protein
METMGATAGEAAAGGDQAETAQLQQLNLGTDGSNDGGDTPGRVDDAGNLVDRVASYMERKRVAAVAKLREALGSKILAYDVVYEARVRSLAAADILGGADIPVPAVGSLLHAGNGRTLYTNLTVDIGQQRTAAATFEAVSGHIKCKCRRSHSDGGGDRRRIIVLGDQAVPPTWETHGAGEDCILILRVEFGSLKELVEELSQRLRGMRLAAGSLVLLFSALHLAAVGTAASCSDLVEASEMVKRRLGTETVCAALPPIFLNGCGDGPTIRSAVEVGMWAARFFSERTALKNTMKTATDIMAESGAMGFLPATSRRLRLPYGGGGQKICKMPRSKIYLPID